MSPGGCLAEVAPAARRGGASWPRPAAPPPPCRSTGLWPERSIQRCGLWAMDALGAPAPAAAPSSARKELKIVIVGDGGCGKTSLLMVYCQGSFPEVRPGRWQEGARRGLGPQGTRGVLQPGPRAQSLDRAVLGVSFRQPFENSWAQWLARSELDGVRVLDVRGGRDLSGTLSLLCTP